MRYDKSFLIIPQSITCVDYRLHSCVLNVGMLDCKHTHTHTQHTHTHTHTQSHTLNCVNITSIVHANNEFFIGSTTMVNETQNKKIMSE